MTAQLGLGGLDLARAAVPKRSLRAGARPLPCQGPPPRPTGRSGPKAGLWPPPRPRTRCCPPRARSFSGPQGRRVALAGLGDSRGKGRPLRRTRGASPAGRGPQAARGAEPGGFCSPASPARAAPEAGKPGPHAAAGCACAEGLPAARRPPPASGARLAGRIAPPQLARPRGGVSSAGSGSEAARGRFGRSGRAPSVSARAAQPVARSPRDRGSQAASAGSRPAQRPQVSAPLRGGRAALERRERLVRRGPSSRLAPARGCCPPPAEGHRRGRRRGESREGPAAA